MLPLMDQQLEYNTIPPGRYTHNHIIEDTQCNLRISRKQSGSEDCLHPVFSSFACPSIDVWCHRNLDYQHLNLLQCHPTYKFIHHQNLNWSINQPIRWQERKSANPLTGEEISSNILYTVNAGLLFAGVPNQDPGFLLIRPQLLSAKK